MRCKSAVRGAERTRTAVCCLTLLCALFVPVAGASVDAVAPPDPPGGIQPIYCNAAHSGWYVIGTDSTMVCRYHWHNSGWVVYYPSWGYVQSCPASLQYTCWHWDEL